MATFEIIVIVLLTAIVVLLAWHCTLTRNNYSLNQTKELKKQQDFERLFRKIGAIELLAVDSRRILKELTDIVDKMHRNMCAIMAEKMVEQRYPIEKGKSLDSPFQPPFNPTCETTNNSEDVYAECRRLDAINTASVCENMTKIQKELQKKGGQDGN